MNTLKTKNLFQQLVSMKYGLPLSVYNLHVAHKRSLLLHWFVSTGVVLGHVLFTVPVFALLAGPCSREFWQMACVATFLPMLVDRSQIWRMCLLLNTPWTLLRRLDTCKIQAYCLVQAKRAHKHYLMLYYLACGVKVFFQITSWLLLHMCVILRITSTMPFKKTITSHYVFFSLYCLKSVPNLFHLPFVEA